MSQALYKMGRFAARHPWKVIGVWLLATFLIVAASIGLGRQLEDTFTAPGLDSNDAAELLAAVGSDQAGLTAQVLLTPSQPTANFFDSADDRAALDRVQAALAALPDVVGTTDTAAALGGDRATATESGLVSPDGGVALIRIQYPGIEELDAGHLASLEELGRELAVSLPVRIEMGGDLFFALGEPETGTGEMIGLVAAVVVLLVAFGSIVAMGLPIGMALFGLALGVSAMSLITYLVEIPAFAPVMASMVGLGVGIDYALFLVVRHRENLGAGMAVPEAVGKAVATAGQAVVFAGGTVVVAILGLAVAGIPFLTAAGIGISVVVLIMVLASVTLLPAFLGLAGHRINRRGRRDPMAAAVPTISARWQRWGTHVSKHAWPYAVGVTVVLLGLSAPVLSLRLGFPDEGTLPESSTRRQAYDLVSAGFGPGTNGPLVIAVDIGEDPSVLRPLAAAIADDPGIVGVSAPEIDAGAQVATLIAIPTTAPQDDSTFETITRLRSDVLPGVLDASPARAHIGGQTATFADLGDRVAQRLPLFIAAVVALSFLLLTIVFRSILVPLKAAILNLLSIGAAYGVLVMVFQWGWGAGLIGLESTVPIVSFIPMLMFAILFGLSMDYEVFLLSRVREEHLATGDNEWSVIRGLAGTARVITSAALIMISVFGGFVLGDDPVLKMLGLGLATAIFVDVTAVRLVLVPASMKLMGEANWWLPAWLDRRLPVIDIDGGTGPGETAPSSPTCTTPSPHPEVVTSRM